MSGTLPAHPVNGHLLSRETPAPTMAKAVLTEREKRARFGQILRRAAQIANCSRKEAACRLGVDEGQLGRWYSGDENAQVHRYHADPSLRDALRVAEAEDAGNVTVRTVIEMTRPA
jgi:hypothetical protein